MPTLPNGRARGQVRKSIVGQPQQLHFADVVPNWGGVVLKHSESAKVALFCQSAAGAFMALEFDAEVTCADVHAGGEQ